MAHSKKSLKKTLTAGKKPSTIDKARRCKTLEEQCAGHSDNGGLSGSEAIVTVDQRRYDDRRKAPDRRQKDVPVAVERRKLQRRAKVNRRRQIDPTTCERDYSAEEIEFMNALDQYKRASGRMFPTCSEILEVIRGLGYAKQTPVAQGAAEGVQAGHPPISAPIAIPCADSDACVAPIKFDGALAEG